MSDPAKKVECGHHGTCAATFVCQHLATGAGCGFHHAGGDDPWPDAWCDLCNEIFEQEGEWTERGEAIAQISLMCAGCYEQARERNRRVPPPLRPGALRLSAETVDELQRHACRLSQQLQDHARDKYALSSYERWDIASERPATIVFSTAGAPRLVADFQVVGSLSLSSRTWLWAWANGHLDAEESWEIDRLRVFGTVRGIERLTSEKWSATEEDAWDMTALAAHVLGTDAVYRAPSGQVMLFLLMRNLRRMQ